VILILTVITGRSPAFAQADCKIGQLSFDTDMQFTKQHLPTRVLSCSGVAFAFPVSLVTIIDVLHNNSAALAAASELAQRYWNETPPYLEESEH
jgi:hypothetical protein